MIVSTLRRYVLGFNVLTVTRDQILAFLDTRPEVQNWYTILPGQVYVISDRSASELAYLLRQRFAGELFTVAEIANIDGAMPPEVWDFLSNPRPSGLWAGTGTQFPGAPPLPPDILR